MSFIFYKLPLSVQFSSFMDKQKLRNPTPAFRTLTETQLRPSRGWTVSCRATLFSRCRSKTGWCVGMLVITMSRSYDVTSTRLWKLTSFRKCKKKETLTKKKKRFIFPLFSVCQIVIVNASFDVRYFLGGELVIMQGWREGSSIWSTCSHYTSSNFICSDYYSTGRWE